MQKRSLEWYKSLLKKIIADDMEQMQNQEQAYSVLWEMKQKFGFEDIETRNFAMKASKYVHEMADFEYRKTGQEAFRELYWKLMLLEAQSYQVDSALLYLEKNRVSKERFYEPRREVFLKHGITQALQDLMDDKIDILSVSLPPGTGKELIDDTPILTAEGWKKHGDLIVGDKVYGIDGNLKKVIHVFPKEMADCLVTFTNGEQIQCHENHEWLVYDRHKQKERIIETKELFLNEIESGTPGKRGHRYYYLLPQKECFHGELKELPVKPYTMGAWLGDGTNTVQNNFDGLRNGLQKCGMCYSRKTVEKYIPEIYLTASIEQRLDLLAGLLDTDGTLVRKERKYKFSTTGEKLKDGFIKLISTFGWRCNVSEEEPKESTSGIIGRKKYTSLALTQLCTSHVGLKENNFMSFQNKEE